MKNNPIENKRDYDINEYNGLVIFRVIFEAKKGWAEFCTLKFLIFTLIKTP
jgi:hypothetical protein